MIKKILLIATLAISCLAYGQKIAAGAGYSYGICPNGSVMGWGSNYSGHLGTDTYGYDNHEFEILPVQITGVPGTVTKISTCTEVSADYYPITFFLKNDGTVWASGANYLYQMGEGVFTGFYDDPIQLPSLSGITDISSSEYNTLFLKNDGTVWGCGANLQGQLGLGHNMFVDTIVQIPITGTVTAIASGETHSLFLKSDSTVWACGENTYGQLGAFFTVPMGSTTLTPVQVAFFGKAIAIDASKLNSVILKKDGTVYISGDNYHGILGTGNCNNQNFPVKIAGLDSIKGISAGGDYTSHFLFLKNDGTVWGLGDNRWGQLGLGDDILRKTPTQISSLSNIVEVATGLSHSLFLKNDGTLWACGSNWDGELGNGTSGPTMNPTPTQVQSLCLPPPTVPPTATLAPIPNNSVCQGAPVNVSAVTYGSNPDRQVVVDNSIILNNPIAIDKNSTGVFVLNDNTSITKYDFNGAVVSTYPNLSHLNIWAFTVDESDNVYINNGSTDGSGNPVFIKCDPTGTTIDSIPNGFMSNPNYITDMVHYDNPPALENLFVADTGMVNSSINAINMNDNNPFTNNVPFNIYNKHYTSLSVDNFYPEKRLLMADPINNTLEQQALFNYTATPSPLLDSALTAGMALDFISADTTYKTISVSSQTTGILGIVTTTRNSDSTISRYIDTSLTSAVNAIAPVGMVLVKKGNLLQYWIADNGQNKLLRFSIYSYQITPTLPDGLIFNSITSVIEGTPTTVTAPQTYTLSIYSLLGSTSSTFTLGVSQASGISNTPGTSTSSANQPDGQRITHTASNTCTQLAVLTDFVGDTSPGYTQVSQTVSTSNSIPMGNKNVLRRSLSVRAQQTENLNASLTLWFTFQDVQAYNLANPSNLLSNDTLSGSMPIATLHMHDTIILGSNWGKKAIIDTSIFAQWLPATHLWQASVHVSQLSDFYIGPRSIANGFTCSTTGADTLTANDYYIWNYDTLFTSGDYVDTLVNRTGCDSITGLHLTINSTVGLNEMANGSGINVYPNPTKGLFTIHFNTSAVEPTRVRVLNLLGKEVYNKVHTSSTSVDLSSADNGIYFVIIEGKEKQLVWRIVKQD